MAAREGSAEWRGDLKGGEGTVTVGAGVFTGAYTYRSRFEDGEGTNPEELIAAAHAACFTLALSNTLAQAGHTPEQVRTTAHVHLGRSDAGAAITKIALETEGRVPGIDQATFDDHARAAKDGCIVSRALAGVPDVTVSARLAS